MRKYLVFAMIALCIYTILTHQKTKKVKDFAEYEQYMIFESKNLKLFFTPKDEAFAIEIVNFIDEEYSTLKQVFDISESIQSIIIVHPSEMEFRKKLALKANIRL